MHNVSLFCIVRKFMKFYKTDIIDNIKTDKERMK